MLDRKKIKIRKCRAEDYWFCYYLLKRNMLDYIERHQGGWDSKRYRNNFREINIKVIEYGRKRIAFYDTEKRENELILVDVQIANKYQSRGLGTYLFGIIERRAKKSGFKKIVLGVYWDNPSMNLYKRLGFKIEKRRKSHAVMSKII